MRLAVNTALYALAASLTLLDATSAGAALPAKACDLMTQQTATAIYGHPVRRGGMRWQPWESVIAASMDRAAGLLKLV